MIPDNDTEHRTAAKQRSFILPGITVDIVTKADQRSGNIVRGIVKDVLTSTSFHPHGIKVRLQDGRIGRVRAIVPSQQADDTPDTVHF